MKTIKVTLKKLFVFLDATTQPIDTFKEVDAEISVKTPNGDYTKLLGVIRKTDDKIKITTDAGSSIVCGAKHIFIDENDREVYCQNASTIKTTRGIETIVSKTPLGHGDVYDVAIDAPHLYVTPNGLIHHNSTFLKNLIHRSKSNAKVAYDETVLSNDGFFAGFIEDDAKFLVMEDADNFLSKRSNGNSMMHRFLNVSDGLISAADKKLVFSTNLPSVKDIDAALIRPGRCFDVVTFNALTRAQAQRVIDEVGSGSLPPDKEKITLAEIFSTQQNAKKSKPSGMGFV